jgi:hypothetical protein
MKHFAVFVSTIFILTCLALPCIALESNVFTLTEKTLSVDLGPSFELNKSELNTSQTGIVSQDFLINDIAKEEVAFLSVMSVYDEMMGMLSPDLLSELFLIGVLSEVESKGDVEIGNWTTTDVLGNNVTVHTLSTEDERVKPLGGTHDTAIWNLDQSTYVVLVSFLDENNTTQLIKTLAVR